VHSFLTLSSHCKSPLKKPLGSVLYASYGVVADDAVVKVSMNDRLRTLTCVLKLFRKNCGDVEAWYGNSDRPPGTHSRRVSVREYRGLRIGTLPGPGDKLQDRDSSSRNVIAE